MRGPIWQSWPITVDDRARLSVLGGRPVHRPFDGDPTTLPGAEPFFAYSVDADDQRLTAWCAAPEWCVRVFVAEGPDEVRIAVVFDDAPPSPYVGGVAGWGGMEASDVRVQLERPLGERCVIDAVRGERVHRVTRPPDAEDAEDRSDRWHGRASDDDDAVPAWIRHAEAAARRAAAVKRAVRRRR
ncbi:MAG: hypothetical protein PGN13_05285 [Patulibacter minatonensis]